MNNDNMKRYERAPIMKSSFDDHYGLHARQDVIDELPILTKKFMQLVVQ